MSFFPVLALAPAASAQGFVENSAGLGIVHEVSSGFDQVADSLVSDWIQRGLALSDNDGDGDLDIFACGGILQNTSMRKHAGVFQDVSFATGLEAGEFDVCPALADFDLDGDPDLIIGVLDSGSYGGPAQGRNRFYRNRGDGTFEEISTLAWTPGNGHTLMAQWADLDLDGLADLYLSEFYTTDNVYYRNNGDGTFTDMSAAAGLDLGGSTHVTAVLDSDLDGLLDVFVGNDWIVSFWTGLPDNETDLQAQGQPDGTWLDVSPGSGQDLERGIMGITLGDVDYDGDMDMYKSDVQANRLMLNAGWPGGTKWTQQQAYFGIEADVVPDPFNPPATGRGVGWGTVFMDFDFDLWLDLFLVNGQVAGLQDLAPYAPRGQRNFLWTGDGPSNGFRFTDETQALGIYDEIDDRCCAVGDMDEDGDIDIFVQSTWGFLRYFENQIDPQGQGYLMVEPVCNTSAPGGFGVEARFTDSLGYPHERVIGQDGPTASQHANFAYFGLGNEASVDLEVEFPSGIKLSFPNTLPNTKLTPVEPELIRVPRRTVPLGSITGKPAAAGPGVVGTSAQYARRLAVTAFAHDQAGNPLGAGAAVTIEVPGLTPKGPVLYIGGNEYRRYFLPPAGPGAHRATVTFNGFEVRIKPRIHFYDPNDSSGTTASVIPEAVRAGSADTFDVIVAPKDSGGISLGRGRAVDIQVAGLVPLAGPTDLGDGRYSATFPSPTAAGIHDVTVTDQGKLLSLGLEIEAGGAVSPLTSSILQVVPHHLNSAAPHQLKVLLTARDASGIRTGPKTAVDLVTIPDPGTPAVLVRQDLYPDGQRDGDFPFIVEKPLGAAPGSATGTLQILIDGSSLALVPYAF